MVPYVSESPFSCKCKGCQKTPRDTPWACYKYDAATKQWLPAEDGCQECVTTLLDAVAPQKSAWKSFAPRLAEPQTAMTFEEWRLRRAGLPTNFDKSNVTADEDFEVNWIDSHLPKTEADLQAESPQKDLPKNLPWVDVVDGHGQTQRVVLVYQSSRVEISHKTTAHMATRLLSADRQLRERQGADALREARKRSKAPQHITQEQLSQMMSSGTTPMQPEDEVLDALMLSEAPGAGHKRSRMLRSATSNPEEPEGKHVRSEPADTEELRTRAPPVAPAPDVEGPAKTCAAAAGSAAAGPAAAGSAAPAPNVQGGLQSPEGEKSGRGRGRGNKGAGGRARGGKQGGKRDSEVEFNLMNTLSGLIEKPRVELYNRRQRLPGFAKQAHESEVMAEESQIKVLEAAINLSPAEIRNVDQTVLISSVKVVQKTLAGSRWPKETILELTRRAAMAHLESPGEFLKIAYPFSSADSPAGTQVFDPTDPRLCQQAAHVSMEAKIEAFENLVVKDFMAIALRKGQEGMPILAAMGKSFHEYYRSAAAEDVERCSELSKCVLAVSALAQQTAITPDQFEAFEALDQGKCSFASALQPCLADLFWEDRKALVWDVAAYESTTHAILDQIVQALGKGDPCLDVDDAWGLAQKRWAAWTQKMRLGALKPVADALAQQLVSEAGALQEQAAPADVALSQAKRLVDRASWLTEVAPSVGPQLTDTRRILTNAVTGWDAQVKMSEGNRLLHEMITTLDADEEVTLGMVKQLRAEYDGCVGICPPADITDDLEKLLEFLAHVEAAESTSDHAWLAMRVNTLLLTAAEAQGGATDAEDGGSSRADSPGTRPCSCADSPGTRPSRQATDAWTKTAKGFELHEALGEQTKGNVRIATLAEKLESYHDQSGEALEAFREFLEPRVAEARQELTSKEQCEWESMVQEATHNLAVLASKAGGKPDGSWKADLNDDSSWEDVQREAHLSRVRSAAKPLLYMLSICMLSVCYFHVFVLFSLCFDGFGRNQMPG